MKSMGQNLRDALESYNKYQNAEIQVCDQCLRACCWQGMFMCEDSYSAGTTYKTRRELKEGKHGESPHYWKTDDELMVL